ncbi:hypothetical protein HDU97_008781 [Phlyctochytrium planicorne]|nr:hypothetical protein HDU97_008781 [Phlyctochytrium planicorne]
MRPSPQEEELLRLMQALLSSNPQLINTLRNLVNDPNLSLEPPAAYVDVPDLGEVAVSHTALALDGSYVLPPYVLDEPPLLTMLTEALEGLLPFVPRYSSILQQISDLLVADDELKAKKKVVDDLERTIETNKKLIQILDEQLEKDAKDVKKLEQGLSLKKMKAKMTGKFDEIRQKELQDLEKSKSERESRERAIGEATAKLEKARLGYNLAKRETDGLPNLRFDLKALMEEVCILCYGDVKRLTFSKKAFNSFEYPTIALESFSKSIRIIDGALEKMQIDLNAIKAARHLIYLSVALLGPMIKDLMEFTISPRFDLLPNSPRSIEFKVKHDEVTHHLQTMAKVLPEIAKDLPALATGKIEEVFVVKIRRDMHNEITNYYVSPLCQATLNHCNKAIKRLKELAPILAKTYTNIEALEDSTRTVLAGRKHQLAIFRMECFERWAGTKMEREGLAREKMDEVLPLSSFILAAMYADRLLRRRVLCCTSGPTPKSLGKKPHLQIVKTNDDKSDPPKDQIHIAQFMPFPFICDRPTPKWMI